MVIRVHALCEAIEIYVSEISLHLSAQTIEVKYLGTS